MSSVNIQLEQIKKQISEMQSAALLVNKTRAFMNKKYQSIGGEWRDQNYNRLGQIVSECSAALINLEKIFLTSQKSLLQIKKEIIAYEETDIYGVTADTSGYIHTMNSEDVNLFWRQGVSTNNELIEGYREELNSLGIPNGAWLDTLLATHLNSMNERLAAELNMASGNSENIDLNSIYPDIGDYPSFFEGIRNDFDNHCRSDVNPHFGEGNQWGNNCQRCVPTYEQLRRGELRTVQPFPGGLDHLSYHPYDVWDNPNVYSSTGSGINDIRTRMLEWGDGSRAQVVVYWDGPLGGGHTFIAEQIDGETRFYDPQTYNSRNSENYIEPEDYFSMVAPNQTTFCRIDNLDYSSFINDCSVEVG